MRSPFPKPLSKLRQSSMSLFSRLALLVVISILVTQIFTLWLASVERNRILTDQLYNDVLDNLANLEGTLDGLNPYERQLYLQTYNRPGFPRLLPKTASDHLRFNTGQSSLGEDIAEKLSATVNEPISVKWRRSGDKSEMWVPVRVLGTDYWLVMPMGRYINRTLTSFFLAAALASFFAIALAFVIAWHTNRPLRRLSEAAQELELGRMPHPVEESGPQEIRTLAERFNLMTGALNSAASERRLMLAGLSHDLRTPLTRLKLLLEMQEPGPDHDDMLDDIEEMSRIVRQFIDFARAEESTRREPVALADLTASVSNRFSRSGVDVRFVALQEVAILGDALALERLLTNLIENARRYGKPPIKVTLEANTTHAMIRVTDYGDGIPANLRQAALAPFERLAEHRGTDGGSGLGLAIVSRIIKQHHGMLTFVDETDGGFSIVVSLPLLESTTN